MNPKKLTDKTWKECVNSMPIFGIDMLIYLQDNGILMGRRINEPAKGKFFVPGGRVYKNEKRVDAFHRILLSETGLKFDFNESKSIGLYEHFYDTNKWDSKDCETHYVIEARLLELKRDDENIRINLKSQHSDMKWISIKDIISKDIHEYSKLYLEKVKEIFSLNQ